MPVEEDLDQLRSLVAEACRVLAHRGAVDTVLGHVSCRVGEDRMLLRCRGPHERGLRFSTATDVRLLHLDGTPAEEDDGYRPPNEHPIHGETLRRRPEFGAVVHAHPPAVVACSIAGLELRPIFGSWNIPAMRMAERGVPVYQRSVLIRRPDLAAEMLAAMGSSRCCVLAGHGVTVGAASVEEAVVATLDLQALASMTLAVASTGRHPEVVPERDLAELPDLGSELNMAAVWRYYTAAAAADS
ncbi:MAG: class II aldolase/adducin family protein [Acidobacteriota bacterium]|nr:class II aldolase/adducin family protein [Acidobacteriota bacterium]